MNLDVAADCVDDKNRRPSRVRDVAPFFTKLITYSAFDDDRPTEFKLLLEQNRHLCVGKSTYAFKFGVHECIEGHDSLKGFQRWSA